MIDPVSSSSFPNPGHRQAKPARPEPARALVPVRPVPVAERATARTRPCTAFLAHLIATAQQAPQTREKRRVEPRAAIIAYEAAGARIGRPAQ